MGETVETEARGGLGAQPSDGFEQPNGPIGVHVLVGLREGVDGSYLRKDFFDAMKREMETQSAELCGCIDPSDVRAIEEANAALEAAVTAKYHVFLSLYEALVHRIELVNVLFSLLAHAQSVLAAPPPDLSAACFVPRAAFMSWMSASDLFDPVVKQLEAQKSEAGDSPHASHVSEPRGFLGPQRMHTGTRMAFGFSPRHRPQFLQ